MKNINLKRFISIVCAIVLLAVAVFEPSWFGKTGKNVDEVNAATSTELPTDLVELGWHDFTGFEYQEYSGSSGTLLNKGTYSGTNLDKTLLNVDVIVSNRTAIRYAGPDGWNGLRLYFAEDASNTYLYIQGNGFGTIVSGGEYLADNGAYYTNTALGVDSFVDQTFNLKISTEITGSNYTFGIWINNVMVGGYITFTANANTTGTTIGLTVDDAESGSIKLVKPVYELPTDFVELGWDDFAGFEYQEYSGSSGTLLNKGTYSGANLDKTLLNVDVMVSNRTAIRYAGPDGWNGLRLYFAEDASNTYLYIQGNGFGTIVSGGEYLADNGAYYTNTALGVDSFVDQTFNLKISTEITGSNYTFGIWINNVLVGGYITFTANANTTGTTIGLTVDDAESGSVKLIKSVDTEIETDFVELGWHDFEGFEYQEYSGSSGTLLNKGTYSGANLDKTLLNVDVIVSNRTAIRYAGPDGWNGLRLYFAEDASNTYLYIQGNGFGTIVSGGEYLADNGAYYTNTSLGVNSFVDQTFNLKISTEITGSNYTFGIWINNVMVGGYITFTANANTTGTTIGLTVDDAESGSIKLVKPVYELPTDFVELDWDDFAGFEYQEYSGTQNTLLNKGTYSGESLDKTLLNVDVMVSNRTAIRYAGPDGWNGLRLYFAEDASNTYLYIQGNGFGTIVSGGEYLAENGAYYTNTALGVDSFVDQTFNLKISTEITGSNYTFGIWINNVLVGGYITFTANANTTGTTIGLTVDDAESGSIKLVKPVYEVTDFVELRWTDFKNLAYGNYPDLGDGTFAGSGSYSKASNLHLTLFNDNVSLGNKAEIRYGADGWSGLGIQAVADLDTGATFLYLFDHWKDSNNPVTTLDSPEDYNLTSFVAQEFNLKISTEIVGNNCVFRVWINDVLVGYYSSNTNGSHGTTVALHGRGGGDGLKLIKLEIDPPTDFIALGWNDFTGLICKEYVAANPDTTGAKGTYSGSLHRTLLEGDIIFGGNTDIRYGGTGWSGIVLEVARDGSELYLRKGTYTGDYTDTTYYPANYGLASFKDTKFNLKISTEISGDNYTFGVWINNQILGNYFTVTKGENTAEGTCLGLYDRDSGNSITLVGEQVPTDYTILTPLTSFGIKSGTYTAPNGGQADTSNGAPSNPANGVLDGVLDETATVFDKVIIQFHTIKYEENVDLGFGGYNIWTGYRLGSNGENLRLYSGYGEIIPKDSIILTDEIAGVDVVGGEYNLKISMAYIDSTTVQMGIWFDDILYNNEYFMIDTSKATGDIANDIGGDDLGLALGVLSQNGGGTIIIGEEVVTLPDFYWNKADGAYTLPDTAKIGSIDDGESISELTELGANNFLYHADGRIYERTVYIWQIGNVIEDDKVDSRDLVRTKSLKGSVEDETWSSSKEAADFDKDKDVDDTDAYSMRRLLVGDEFNYDKTLSEKLLGGVKDNAANVMPIVGFNGPSTSSTVTADDGDTYTSFDMLSDEMIDDIYTKIQDAGVNLIAKSDEIYSDSNKDNVEKQLVYATNKGIAMFVQDARIDGSETLSHEELQRYLESYEDYDSFAGLYVYDELRSATDRYPYDSTDESRYMGASFDDLSSFGKVANEYAGLNGYVNLFPYWNELATNDTTTYQSYIAEYVEKFNPQYLSFDHYVFSRIDAEGEATAYDDYMKNLVMIREAAREKDIPFWSFVQAGSDWLDLNDDGKAVYGKNESNNVPSEGQFKWQANLSLAMGAQGIAYFPLVQPHYFALSKKYSTLDYNWGATVMRYDRNGLIGADGSTTVWYGYAQEVNKQIAAIDHVLMNATNKGIVVTGGAATYLNGDLNSLCDSSNPVVIDKYNRFTGVTAGNDAGAAVGCFDYNGKTALYVVNYDMSSEQNITLNFSESVTTDVTISGTATEKSGTSITLTLGAGEGALVVLE